MNRDVKTITDWLIEKAPPAPDRVYEAVHRLTAKKRGPARVIAFPGKTKADRKAERISRLDAILSEVRARCLKHGGGCEFCGWEQPAEFHHVLSGGQRRYAESVETIAFICADCHRQWHRGTDIVFERAMMWAAFYGYGKTRHAIEYRVAKAAEARAAQGGTR